MAMSVSFSMAHAVYELIHEGKTIAIAIITYLTQLPTKFYLMEHIGMHDSQTVQMIPF